MKPSPRSRATSRASAGSEAVTVTRAPDGISATDIRGPVAATMVRAWLVVMRRMASDSAPAAGDIGAESARHLDLHHGGVHGYLVHIDQVLPQGLEVHLRPISLRVGLEDAHDLRDRPKRSLPRRRRLHRGTRRCAPGKQRLVRRMVHRRVVHRLVERRTLRRGRRRGRRRGGGALGGNSRGREPERHDASQQQGACGT